MKMKMNRRYAFLDKLGVLNIEKASIVRRTVSFTCKTSFTLAAVGNPDR